MMRIKVTEGGVTIPQSLLPDFNEVLIRGYNGVIEVAPPDENRIFPLKVLGRKFDLNSIVRESFPRTIYSEIRAQPRE